MKYIGIDYGTSRIGIALSDEDATFAFPRTILNERKALTEIVRLCAQEDIGGIVMGYSIASNGAENDVGTAVARFKEKVARMTSTPIYLEREDFSSVEAHRYQTKAGDRDDSAAAIILQRYLDRLGTK